MELHQQKCVPCEGGTLPLSQELIDNNLKNVSEWKQAGNKIAKHFEFKDFVEAMKFVNTTADIAEKEGHHPDISVSYHKVDITLWTHAINGLSTNDFILAAKIDQIK